MATSVRTFSRSHPSDDVGHQLTLDRLDAIIVRIEALAAQQEGGHASKRAAAARLRDVRRRLQLGLLRLVVMVAKDVASEAPGVAEKFPLPSFNATNAGFRASAHDILDAARANRELLARHGLSAGTLENLACTIDELDVSLQEAEEGKQRHVGARAEMKALCDEIMRLVGMLDGFNRYRFHHDPELIVAWESAKHLMKEESAKDAEPKAAAPGELTLEPPPLRVVKEAMKEYDQQQGPKDEPLSWPPGFR